MKKIKNKISIVLTFMLAFNIFSISASAMSNNDSTCSSSEECSINQGIEINELQSYELSPEIKSQIESSKQTLTSSILNDYKISENFRSYEYENKILIYYNLSGSNINSDYTFVQFVIDKSSNKLLGSSTFVTLSENNNSNHIMTYNNTTQTSNLIINDDTSIKEGWKLNSNNEKVDLKNENKHKRVKRSFAKGCINRCYANYNVPLWVIDAVNLTMAGSCLFGPNPVCLSSITIAAGIFGGKIIGCIRNCWR